MPRLIDADALESNGICFTVHGGAKFISLESVRTAPTIEAEPVKHGRWEADKEDIYWGNHMVRMFCSCCKQTTYFDREKGKFILFDYCPNCGAKMDGGAENA